MEQGLIMVKFLEHSQTKDLYSKLTQWHDDKILFVINIMLTSRMSTWINHSDDMLDNFLAPAAGIALIK